jgi:predicted permease
MQLTPQMVQNLAAAVRLVAHSVLVARAGWLAALAGLRLAVAVLVAGLPVARQQAILIRAAAAEWGQSARRVAARRLAAVTRWGF